MCYTGECIWENYGGDCRFPDIPEVRNKYPFPICSIGIESNEEQEETAKAIKEIQEIILKYKIKIDEK